MVSPPTLSIFFLQLYYKITKRMAYKKYGRYRRRLQPNQLADVGVGGNRRPYALNQAIRNQAIQAGLAGGRALVLGTGKKAGKWIMKKAKDMIKKRTNRKPATKLTEERGTGGYNQWQVTKIKTGRAISNSLKDSLVLRGGVNRVIYYFKGLSGESDGTFTGNSGNYWLSHFGPGDLSVRTFPVYVFNLTNVYNDALVPTPFYRLQQSGAGTFNFNWSIMSGQTSSGGSSTSLLVQESPGTSISTTQPGARSFLDWVRIRLNVYGATSRPSRVKISIVQFFDDDMQPEKNAITGTQKHNQFWQSRIKPLISNPIAGNNSVVRGAMKVLFCKVVDIDPTMTTESDPDPHMRTLDIFQRMNMLLNFQGDRGVSGTVSEIYSAQRTKVDANSDSFDILPSKTSQNRYLLIEGVNHTPLVATGDAGTTNTTNSSFDLHVQTCHKILDAF